MRTVGRVLLVVAIVASALGGSAHAGVLGAGAPTAAPAATAPPSDGVTTGMATPSTAGPEARAAAGAASPPRAVDSARQTALTTQTDVDVRLEQAFQLTPERPGEVRVTYNYSLAERIVSLETTIPESASVLETDGFEADNETVYAWDEVTDEPSITVRLPVNETGSREYAAANGSLLFADVGEWALFRRPSTTTQWEAIGLEPVTFDRQTVTVGPGAAGEWLVFLGNVTLHPRTVGDQTLRLAVPAAANTSESPDDILDALERASVDLSVGERDQAVFAVAAPTEGVPWAARGLTTGGTDFWVAADERLDTPDNIWVHEYVHTRQAYETTAETHWTTEGFAAYFATRQALQHQSVTYEEFAAALSTPDAAPNVTLADPDTWNGLTAYERGSLVAGQIDRRLRLETDGERSLDSVLNAMNGADGPVNGTELLARIGDLGNESVRSYAAEAIRTDRPVTVWNRSQHVAAFGSMPARFQYQLPTADTPVAYRVVGPYRNTSMATRAPLTLVTGETLVVNARVRNVGNVSGFYDADLRVNGSTVDSADGGASPNGTRLVPLEHTFDTPGTYTMGVGNDTTTVRVRRPANASIVGISVTNGSVPQYGTATLGVTVRNDASIPARRTLNVRRGAETVATRSVRVEPYSKATARIEVAFPTAGTTDVAVDDAGSLQVEVRPRPEPTPLPKPGSEGTGTSNGPTALTGAILWPVAALFAIVAAFVLVRVQR